MFGCKRGSQWIWHHLQDLPASERLAYVARLSPADPAQSTSRIQVIRMQSSETAPMSEALSLLPAADYQDLPLLSASRLLRSSASFSTTPAPSPDAVAISLPTPPSTQVSKEKKHDRQNGASFDHKEHQVSSSTNLYDAVRTGSLSTLQRWIRTQRKNGATIDWNVRRRGPNADWTPLILAVYRGHDKIVSELLNNTNSGQGPTVDAVDRRTGKTSLMFAAYYNRVRIVRMLMDALNAPQHLDMTDRNNETALAKAAANGSWSAVYELLRYRPDVSIQNADGDSALHFAIKAGRARIVHRMITQAVRFGVAVVQRNSEGSLPLHLAAKGGINVIAMDLLDNGAGGANKNATNVFNYTALQIADIYGYQSMAFLIANHQ
ncbi:hypothetical protein GP486_000018 [Trichoglossum hirsutum]|uniref:Ankyrin repeat protein n=1 Tax=Trichoglossum hirsutum TaxID=265104 RepID=A0A9P8LJN4_9PEZI|nr:hypothetical protein GP486_000018 [Trichoglossum hirsutum]